MSVSRRGVASDEVLVAAVKPLEILGCRYARELAARTAVAFRAREHEVPHAVPVDLGNLVGQGVREEVVDVAEAGLCGLRQYEHAFGAHGAVGRVNGRIAVEAVALLIAVERPAGRSDVFATGVRLGHECLAQLIVGDAQQAGRDVLRPCGFDEVPA